MLHEYLQLSTNINLLTSLLSSPTKGIIVSMAIYSELDSMSQLIIKRLLHLSEPFPFELMRKAWHSSSIPPSDWRPAQNASLLLLKKLNILQGMHGEVFLAPLFKTMFLDGLESFGSIKNNEKISFNNDKSLLNWDLHLYSLINGGIETQTSSTTATTISKIFKSLSFIDDSSHSITNDGFAFLLKKKSQQLFIVIFKYFDSIMPILDKEEGIYFISLLILGITPTYPSPALSPFLTFLEDVNLISHHLTPTHLSLFLRPKYWEEVKIESSLIMETNHKLYFYTKDPLQIAIISSFTQITCKFPNMIGGQLTGSSVALAFKKGITANQLIEYLKSLIGTATSMPMVIEDQIRVWEGMQRRLHGRNKAILYQNFANPSHFTTVKDEAHRIGSLLYSNPLKKVLIIKREFEDSIRFFIQSLK